VGDLVGEGASQEQAVVGETPNLAARLQSLAAPGTVVIGPSTRRLIGGLFDYEDLGAVEIKGLAAPVLAARVLGESRAESRFEALRATATPLVGRDEELAMLLRRWQQAKAGEGRMVLVSGEPGIGKSRLAAALLQRIESEPHTRLRYFCSPYHQDSALHPFIIQLERAAGFARNDTVEQKLGKLRELLAPGAQGTDEFELLAELLSLPNSAAELNVSPQRKREMLFEALLHQLEALARSRPVLMVFEDAHWIDPTSRELLDLTLDRIARLPVLVVVTFRPEFQQAWGGQPYVTMLTLDRLGERDVAALVRELAGNAPLGSEVVEEIVGRTDGVPLFVEELTKAVIESGDRDDRVAAVLAASALPEVALPATLHASLTARLDRIGAAAKEIAQIGAVLGREFSYELIEPVAQRSRAELEAALTRLTEAGLLFCRGAPPHASYLFKHALVQDAAYGTLLRSRRRELHARVADALVRSTGEHPEAAPEVKAHHLQNGGRSAEAIGYWREAGDRAAQRAANREAIAHFNRALSLLDARPETPDRWHAEVAILSRICPALMNVHGWSAPQVGEALERTAEVGKRLGNSAEIAPAIANTWIFLANRGQFDRADEISANLFEIARDSGDPEILLQAHHTAWPLRWGRGLLVEATHHIDAGLALYDETRHGGHGYIYLGHDARACALGVRAVVHAMLGYPARSISFETDALTVPRRLAHPPSLAQALMYVCDSRVARSDALALIAPARELLEMSTELGIPQHRGNALVFFGWALASHGETSEGIMRAAEGLSIWAKTGWRAFLTRSLYLMGKSLLAARRYTEGLERVAQALDLGEETGEKCYMSPLHRLRAELTLHARGAADETIETSFSYALAIARQQHAKGWELGAATSLARLWGEQGRRAEARELLAPVYGWFTEGFDSADLKEAKGLLNELT
jgi:predicted ATPase